VFYHAKGTNNPKVEDLRTELRRLETLVLPTLTASVRAFIRSAGIRDLRITTLHVQNLKSHVQGIATDTVVTDTDILALTDTWMHNNETVHLEGYKCVTQFMSDEQRAGGVVVYEKYGATSMATPHLLMKLSKEDGEEYRIAAAENRSDICAADCMVNGENVLIVTPYISNHTPIDDCKRFILSHLSNYTKMVSVMATEVPNTMPIIFTGDININSKKEENQSFVIFMEETLGLMLMSNPECSTTRSKSCIDMVFARYIDTLKCTKFITYFSYHRPILSVTNSG
jgi:exonuclease III